VKKNPNNVKRLRFSGEVAEMFLGRGWGKSNMGNIANEKKAVWSNKNKCERTGQRTGEVTGPRIRGELWGGKSTDERQNITQDEVNERPSRIE